MQDWQVDGSLRACKVHPLRTLTVYQIGYVIARDARLGVVLMDLRDRILGSLSPGDMCGRPKRPTT
jgi:hypothetical protein